MIASVLGFSTLPSLGTAVSRTNAPPSSSGRYRKNTQIRVMALNLNRRHRPQGLVETRR